MTVCVCVRVWRGDSQAPPSAVCGTAGALPTAAGGGGGEQEFPKINNVSNRNALKQTPMWYYTFVVMWCPKQTLKCM